MTDVPRITIAMLHGALAEAFCIAVENVTKYNS